MPDTTYSETVSDSLNKQQQGYRIFSRNDTESSQVTDMHITMRFSGEYSQCANSINLRWTEYLRLAINPENGQINLQDQAANTFNEGIAYEVWGHQGNSFDIAMSEKLVDKSRQTINVKLENLTANTTYFLYVKAILPNGDTATSHRLDIATSNKSFPSVINIDTVSYDESGRIKLHINLDKNTGIDTFALYRSDSRVPLYWYYSAADVPIEAFDNTAAIGQAYKYNIVGFLCGKQVVKSDTVSNILLYATPLSLNTEIKWTEFFNETNTPAYTLLRTSPSELTVDPGNSLYFLDQSTHEYVCRGPQRFCYVMTAKTEKSYSRSQETCASLSATITMPEAIDPTMTDTYAAKNCNCNTDCINPRHLFGPVLDMNDDAYRLQMEIFDKSGVRLFSSTKNFNEPLYKTYHYWDGKYNGNYVKPGIYIYYAKIEFPDSYPATMRGSVTVVMQNPVIK
jgi:hypothetical protein